MQTVEIVWGDLNFSFGIGPLITMIGSAKAFLCGSRGGYPDGRNLSVYQGGT